MSSSFFPAPFLGGSRQGLSPFVGASDFAPFFRLLEDGQRAFDNFPSFGAPARHQQRVFQPRFDVREVENAYELRGELPGVESKDLEVEFTDANTLVVRGRTESEHTEGARPEAIQAQSAQPQESITPSTKVDNSDTVSVHSEGSASSYVRPSVEDEEVNEARENGTAPSSPGAATPAESTVTAQQAPQPEQPQQAEESSQYWLSERRTGSFQRSFAFSSRIDQDAVTANLKNGVLSVVVPKAAEPAARRIKVQ